MASLQVVLLGGFDLRLDGEALAPIPSRAGRSLFAYLVVNRGVPHPRERLAAQFWPELPAARARRRLSHTLWQVQEAFTGLDPDPPYLDVTPEALAFDPAVDYWLDVEEFESRVERFRPVRGSSRRRRAGDRKELQAAIELYRGEFLSGFYDEWVLLEQERLSQLHLDAVGWLVELAKGEGAWEEALASAKRLIHHDPVREDAHREIMRLSVLLGRTSEALRQYERCRAVLAAELGTEPAHTTTKLYDRIARHRGTSADQLIPEALEPMVDELPLVGRDQERDAVVDVLEHALGGRGGSVLIEGDAGVGKSRLAAEGADDAQWRDFTVLYGACGTPGARRPYGPLVEALDAELSAVRLEQLRPRMDDVLLRDLARALPTARRALGPRAADPPRLRDAEGAQRMREAFVRTLTALSGLHPTVLILEDVHGADAETLQVLERLASEVLPSGLVLILTYRTSDARGRREVWEALRTVDRRTRPQRLVLDPLPAHDTAELARLLLGRGGLEPAFVADLQEETGGNPLFVLEVLRALGEEGLPASPDGRLPLTGGVVHVVGTRLAHLTSDVRHVLDHAAVAGAQTEFEVLVRACAYDRAEVADAVDDLLRRGLLAPDPEGYTFRHDLVRRVVLDQFDDDHRVEAHRRIGAAIEALHPNRVEVLAHHAVEAGSTGPAIRYLRESGRRAVELHAYDTARGYLARAAELLDQTPSSLAMRYDILAELEGVLAVLGLRDEQGDALAQLRTLGANDPARAADAARRGALYAAHTDRFQEAEETGRRAVALAEQVEDPEALGQALVALGNVLLWAGRSTDAAEVFRRASTVFMSADASPADARYGLGVALRTQQGYALAAEELEQARAAYVRSGDAVGEAQALGQLAALRTETGDIASALESLEQVVKQTRRIGFRFAEAIGLMNLANLRYATGHTGLALHTYGQADEAFHALGQQRGHFIVKANTSFVRHAILGEDEEASADAEQGLAYFRELGDGRWAAQCLATLASVALRQNDIEEVVRRCAEGRRLATQAGESRIELEFVILLAAAAIRRGAPGESLSYLDIAHAHCRDDHFAVSLPAILALRGRALLERGDITAAAAAASDAVRALRAGVERPYLVHYWAACVFGEAGQTAEFHTQLDAAYSQLMAHLQDLDASQREHALWSIPDHREIVALRRTHRPTEVRRHLTASHTPTGRPLTDRDRVEVSLTLDTNGARSREGRVAARRSQIQHLTRQASNQGALPTIEDLAELLDVSVATIRRDLRALRERGLAVRTRGNRASDAPPQLLRRSASE